MALTEAEKVSIRRHLGYNSAAEANYPWIDTFRALDGVLTSLSAAAETECRAILTRLTAIETALDEALGRLKALQVGSIRLNHEETSRLRSERATWRRELSVLLGVPLSRQGGGMIQVV